MRSRFEKSTLQATVLGFPSCKILKLSIMCGPAVMQASAHLAGRGWLAVWRHAVLPTPECLVQRVSIGSTFALWDSQEGNSHAATFLLPARPWPRSQVATWADGRTVRP